MAELETFFEKYKFDYSITTKSKTWFEQQATLLSKKRISPNRLLVQQQDDLKNSLQPGNLYMFFYDPKHKKTLPYYDKFPLVFPFAKTPDGFIGLNMHYLPYYLRVRLMDKLLQFKNNDKIDATTKLKFSWAMIEGVSKFAAAKPCVKQYLKAHVRTSFLKVNPEDWPTAMMMPVEKFQGASTQQVWADSIRGMK